MYKKRLLTFAPGALAPGVLDRLQRKRSRGLAAASGRTVLIGSRADPIELQVSDISESLPADVPVYVWWSVGGLVCAPMREVDEDEQHRGAVAEQLQQARLHLAEARRNRSARCAPAFAQDVDVQLE